MISDAARNPLVSRLFALISVLLLVAGFLAASIVFDDLGVVAPAAAVAVFILGSVIAWPWHAPMVPARLRFFFAGMLLGAAIMLTFFVLLELLEDLFVRLAVCPGGPGCLY